MKSWLLLLAAILCEVVGTSTLPASKGFTRLGPSLVVAVGYGLAFYFFSLALQTIPVRVAYAVWSGVGVSLVTLVGWVVYGQKLDLAAFVGIGLIMAGVAVLHLFSKAAVR